MKVDFENRSYKPKPLKAQKYITFYKHLIPKGEDFIECSKDLCPFCQFERKVLNDAMTEYFIKRLRSDYSK